MGDEIKYDIFISYSRKDKDTVHKCVNFLKSLGLKVWCDIDGIETGDKFAAKLVNAIKSSRLVLFFSSKSSNESQWTLGEILAAKKYNKKILPVKLDNTDYNESILLILLPLQYTELHNVNNIKELHLIKKAIYKALDINEEKEEDGEKDSKKREYTTLNLCLSVVVAAVSCLIWLILSGEFNANKSLALFTTFMGFVSCIVASCYLTYTESGWSNRNVLQNIFLTQGCNLFISYSMLAFGLSFIGHKIAWLHLPSILVALVALYAMYRVIKKQKYGMHLLWLCAMAFALGSYWWIGPNLLLPVVIFAIGSVAMAVFTWVMKSH